MSLLTSLAAYYKLDEGSGDAIDTSSGGNNLTQFGSIASGTGLLNNCRTITGASGDSFLAAVTGLDPGAAFTVAGWALVSDVSDDIGFWDIGLGQVALNFDFASGNFLLAVDSSPLITGGAPSAGSWVFLAVRYDGFGTWLLNVDGAASFSASYSTASGSSYLELRGTGAAIDVSHDEYGVWTRSLSDDEIATLYGSGTPPGFDSFTSGPATHLLFTAQPSNTTAASTISTVQVSALDASNSVDPTYTGNVTLAIGTNPASGTLSGTLTVAAVAGIATFTDLSIDNYGSGYTLTAASDLTGDTSSSFDIISAAATHLAFTVEPSSATVSAVIAPPIQVSALKSDNSVDSGNASSIALTLGTGSGAIAGTTTVTASSGVATFSDISADTAGAKTLHAASGALTAADSSSFTITVAGGHKNLLLLGVG